jgi:hypothetical protein
MSVGCGRYAAAFALDDPDVLVDAALSCPICLGGESSIEVGLSGDEVNGTCACGACAATWSLALEPQQLLRLALDPPRGSIVRFSERLPPPLLPPGPDEDFDV